MQFKTKALVAALAFVAAGAANASFSSPIADKNGSLALYVTSHSAGDVTAVFDLGLSFNDFIASAKTPSATWSTNNGYGAAAYWNLNTSVVKSNNGFNATLNYGSEWQGFLSAIAGATDVQWGVIASEKNTTTDSRALSTVTDGVKNNVASTLGSNVASMATVNDNFTKLYNSLGTNATDANGAGLSTESTASGAKAYTTLGSALAWGDKAGFGSGSLAGDQNVSLNVWYLDNIGVKTGGKANVLQIGNTVDGVFIPATFTFDVAEGTLLYVAAVPEPETYAMLLAGLGMIALMARRRSM